MKSFLVFLALASAFSASASASAQTLLECKPSMAQSREVREAVIGNLVIDGEEATFFQLLPVFRSVKFDAKLTERETNRRGTVVHYQVEIPFEEIISLSIVESGKKRNAYLQMESVFTAEEPFFEAIPLTCSEI